MSIVKWRPKEEWYPFSDFAEHIHGDVGTLFDFPLVRWAERNGDLKSVWHPAIDISEDKNTLIVKTDLPGMKQEDIDKVKATYKNGVLEVILPKTEEAKPKEIKVQVN